MKTNIIVQLPYDLTIGQVNLNEIVYQVKEIQNEVCLDIIKAVVLEYQEEIVERLTENKFPEKRKGLGFHQRKDDLQGRRCGGRKVRKRGFRSQPRVIKTVFGDLKLNLREVECLKCKARFCPLLNALEIEHYERKEGNFEHEVIEAVIDTNYRRLIEGRSIDISLGGVHNIVVQNNINDQFTKEIPIQHFSGMAGDGTDIKQYRGSKGALRIIIGLDANNRVVPVGSWVNTPWQNIEEDIKKRLNVNEKYNIPLIYDGEPGLEHFLSDVVVNSQRCIWHAPRGLYHSLWEDGLKKANSEEYQAQLKHLVAIEIPEQDYELIKDEDKNLIKTQLEESKKELNNLIETFEQKGYTHATAYLQSLAKNVWSYVDLWLQTGVVCPKTTSLLERIFRELGRRLKKIAWGWSDPVALNISKMILIKKYSRDQWEEFWKNKLGIKGAFMIKIASVKVTADLMP